MAYDSSSDALRKLLLLREHGVLVSRMPREIITLPNGLPYYFVEVTTGDGGTYGIEAYGEEAIGLEKEAVTKTKTLELLVVI